jgi:hypothetical protein
MLMFLHPYCPCSRVSLIALSDLLQRSQKPVRAHVVFFASRQFRGSPQDSESRQRVELLSRVTVIDDYEGTLARRFGAHASGWTVMYNERGQLQFAGGITAGRGQAGSNPGSLAIAALLNGEKVTTHSHCVFGCPLMTESANDEGQVQ